MLAPSAKGDTRECIRHPRFAPLELASPSSIRIQEGNSASSPSPNVCVLCRHDAGTTWGRDPASPNATLLSFAAACERWLSVVIKGYQPQATASDRRLADPNSGCIKWVQTIRCDPDGAVDTLHPSRGCHERIHSGWSGYCECNIAAYHRPSVGATGTRPHIVKAGCSHPQFTCAKTCGALHATSSTTSRRTRSSSRSLWG